MIEDSVLLEKIRAKIASEGRINKHDLVHVVCSENDCFGELDGKKLGSLGITNNSYPKYSKNGAFYVYTESEPVVESVE